MRPEALQVFVRVAELSSMSEAAKQLGMGRARVSRTIQTLEEELGGHLFHRTTRTVVLTPEGCRALEIARRVLAEAEAMATVFAPAHAVVGRVRIDLPVNMGRRFLLDGVPQLLETHPGLELFVGTSDRFVDPIRDGYDCVIRVGSAGDSELSRRKLGELRMVNCVSPGYLQKRGRPRSPDDLAEHRVVHWEMSTGRPGFEWEENGRTAWCSVPSAVTVNGADAYRAACLAGLGIIQVPQHGVDEELASGGLVTVLDDYVCAPMPVVLLHPHGRRPPARVRAVMDALEARLSPEGDRSARTESDED